MDKCLEAKSNVDISETDANGKVTEESKQLDKELKNSLRILDLEKHTMNQNQRKDSTAAKSEIQKFYKDQCIFLTGGTGFLGKVLIEKLLRSCEDIDTIYVLVRPKKGKDPKTRIQDILDDILFHEAHKVNPKGINKVVPIVGDVGLPGIGLSDDDRQLLITRVTIIIHAAATVRFDEKLSTATVINVTGTKEMINLAKECKHLIAFTHVSTAYCNTHVRHVEEKVYEPPMSTETLEALTFLDNNVIEPILPSLLGNRPNTYCLTKAVAEDAVIRHGKGLPLCIFRPSIVVSTFKDPIPGWTDNVYGPNGIVIGVGLGVLRTLYIDVNKVGDLVPVDLTVNAIIVSTYHTAKHFKENLTHIPVYNFVSGPQNPLTWREFIDNGLSHDVDCASTRTVWCIGVTVTNNYYVFIILNFFLHYLPALLCHTYCALTGKKQMMLKFFSKMNKLGKILVYFMTQQWEFSNNNTRYIWSSISAQDKAVFPFDVAEVSWDTFMRSSLLGVRTYVLKRRPFHIT